MVRIGNRTAVRTDRNGAISVSADQVDVKPRFAHGGSAESRTSLSKSVQRRN